MTEFEKLRREAARVEKVIEALKDKKGKFLVSFFDDHGHVQQTLPVSDKESRTYAALMVVFTGWGVDKAAELKSRMQAQIDAEKEKAA